MQDVLEFTCPRCAAEVGERFYGPCEKCRTDLRATQWAEAKQLEVPRYEPKMNVVPNQVAMKD